MCLIVFAIDRHPGNALVLAANRDEFFQRPTAAAAFWSDSPELLAGRDLQGGGTWLGVTRGGRWAAVTNVREPGAPASGERSRGLLVRDYLRGRSDPETFLARLVAERERYPGFNLLLGGWGGVWYYSNRGAQPCRLGPGLYGLSNARLDTPWPKVSGARAGLERLLQEGGDLAAASLFRLLADETRPPDADLPATGVSLEWERTLASRFIRSEDYGTRCSTILRLERDGHIDFRERSFAAGGSSSERGFRWRAPG